MRRYPFYGSAFGLGISNYYSPWGYGYGYGGYGYGGYGYGNFGWSLDPYLFYPFDMYGPTYGSSYGYPGGSAYRDRDRDRSESEMGAIRLRAKPHEAKVYVDGALVGIVDEFDGLSHHLELEAGTHQIELRADGYEPYSTDVTVEAGRTSTERTTMKKTH